MHYALKPDGFLILGESESIGKFTDLFSSLEKKGVIFKKKRVTSHAIMGYDVFQGTARTAEKRQPEKKELLTSIRDERQNRHVKICSANDVG